MGETSVQYERLRPEQIVAARTRCPVAFLPIGTLEWHGVHNPVGLDALKEHQLLIHCARSVGGLVFPPLYYGEPRERNLMELNDPEAIGAKMALPAANFAPGYMYQSVSEQDINFQNLLIHIFHEIKSLGFKVIVVGAGHYPLLPRAKAAADIFGLSQPKAVPRARVWAMSGYDLVKGEFEPCGDHAGKWETSLMMYLDPGMQDLSLLPSDLDEQPLGVSHNHPQESTAEFGREAVAAIVKAVGVKVEEMLSVE